MAIEVSQNGGNPFGKGGDNLRRRRAVSKAAEGLTLLATLIAVAVLVIVVGSVFLKGLSALNLDFFFQTPAVYGASRRRHRQRDRGHGGAGPARDR